MTEELPGGSVLIKHELQLHIQRVPPGGIEGGEAVLAICLDHDQRAVHAAAETGGAGDQREGIGSAGLARVMHQQDGDAEAVSDGFHLADDLVIPGVAVLVGAHLADFLQRVHDDEFDGWVLDEEAGDLLLKAFAHEFGFGGEPEVPGFTAGNFCHTGLNPLPRIFETDVEYVALLGGKIPHLCTGADAVCQPQHEPRLANFRSAGNEIYAASDEPFNQHIVRLKLHVHQVACTDDLQCRDLDLQRAADPFDGGELAVQMLQRHDVIHHITALIAVLTAPHEVHEDAGMLTAVRADGQRRLPVREPGRFQKIGEPGFDLQMQSVFFCHCVFLLTRSFARPSRRAVCLWERSSACRW